MSWQEEATTIIEGHGEDTDDFDFAVLAVSVEGKGKTGRAAKESIQPKITELFSVLGQFTTPTEINKMISSFTTIPYTDYDNDRKPKSGYQATFSLRFEIHALEKVNEVHDAVTDLDVRVYSPTFMIDSVHRETMSKKAFREAFQHSLNQLRSQVRTINEIADNKHFSDIWTITGWEVLPEDRDGNFHYSKGAATLGGSESSPELIIEGKAKITVSIRVGFKFKNLND